MMTKLDPPKLVWFFGKVGCGKSYTARLVAERYGYFWYEGDDDLTPAMVQAIHRKETFTQEMRDEFYDIMAEKLAACIALHPRVAVSQALYRQINREKLLEKFPGLVLVWVRAEDSLIERRLMERGDWVDPELARKKSSEFEFPPQDYPRIDNERDGEESLLLQWEKICRALNPL